MTASMAFGLPGGRGDLDPTSPTSILEVVRTAETLGYDGVWFTDGHLSSVDSPALRARSSPLPLAAAVATATSRIQLGFNVLHAALHDPIRLAADLATLDRLSGGRLIVGVGWPVGSYTRAFRAQSPWGPGPSGAAAGPGGGLPAGGSDAPSAAPDPSAPSRPTVPPALTASPAPAVPPELADPPEAAELFAALDTVVGYWRGEAITIDGARYQVGPRPVQLPHPPIEVAAHTADAVAATAARGHGLLLSATQTTASVAAGVELFTAHGGRPGDVRVERFCFVGESDAQAEEQAAPVVERLTRRLTAMGGDEHGHRSFGSADLDPRRFARETAIIGGPRTVARRLAQLRDDLGVRRVNLRPSFSGSFPLSLQQNTVRLFATHVLPLLAAPAEAAPAEKEATR